jgi:hypothetical protein
MTPYLYHFHIVSSLGEYLQKVVCSVFQTHCTQSLLNIFFLKLPNLFFFFLTITLWYLSRIVCVKNLIIASVFSS